MKGFDCPPKGCCPACGTLPMVFRGLMLVAALMLLLAHGSAAIPMNQWTSIRANAALPIPRYAMAMETIGSEVFLFGGRSNPRVILGDFWWYHLATNVWTNLTLAVNQLPPARMMSSLSVINGSTAVLFGGYGTSPMSQDDDDDVNGLASLLSDVWLLSLQFPQVSGSVSVLATWTQVIPIPSSPSPTPRFAHVAAILQSLLVVFGGVQSIDNPDELVDIQLAEQSIGNVVLGDLWAFNFTLGSWSLLQNTTNTSYTPGNQAPGPRMGALSCPLSPNAFLVASGLLSTDDIVQDTWVLSLTAAGVISWTPLPFAAGASPAVAQGSLACSATSDGLSVHGLQFGGLTTTSVASTTLVSWNLLVPDVTDFTTITWTLATSTQEWPTLVVSPYPKRDSGLVAVAQPGQLPVFLLFGGMYTYATNELWISQGGMVWTSFFTLDTPALARFGASTVGNVLVVPGADPGNTLRPLLTWMCDMVARTWTQVGWGGGM